MNVQQRPDKIDCERCGDENRDRGAGQIGDVPVRGGSGNPEGAEQE